jgi:kynurenine formamidase
MKIIDLSHTIENGLVTYKGLPAPVICDYLSREQSRNIYEEGTEFQIGKIEMVANTGTYIDCPFHRYEYGKDFAALPAELFTDIEGIKVNVPYQQQKAIDASYFTNLELKGRAVLVHTGWSEHWRTDTYFENHPYLSEDAAIFLKDQGVRLVGIDSHNIDDTAKKSRPVHSTLLAQEIFIIEHLCNLDQLPSNGFSFTALPPRIKGLGTFPVRAIAKIS